MLFWVDERVGLVVVVGARVENDQVVVGFAHFVVEEVAESGGGASVVHFGRPNWLEVVYSLVQHAICLRVGCRRTGSAKLNSLPHFLVIVVDGKAHPDSLQMAGGVRLQALARRALHCL